MRRLLSWLVALPIGAVVVLFAVSNRAPVTLSLFPLPAEITTPLFLLPLITLLIGFLWGGVVVFFADLKLRRQSRAERKRAESYRQELMKEKERADAAEAALEAAQGHLPPPIESLEAPAPEIRRLPAAGRG